MSHHDDPPLHTLLATLPPPDVPASVRLRVMASVRDRQHGATTTPASRHVSLPVQAAALAGLALTVAAQVWSPPVGWWVAGQPLPAEWASTVATAVTLAEAGALTIRALYASAAPWASAVVLVAALCCVPSLLLLERLTETRA
jgi:hypothetical protein